MRHVLLFLGLVATSLAAVPPDAFQPGPPLLDEEHPAASSRVEIALQVEDLRPVLVGRRDTRPREALWLADLCEEEVEELVEEEWIGGPPDPVGAGSAEVTLRLRSHADGSPVDARVQLWRLNAPASEHWTDGDQLQKTVQTERGMAVVPQLPEGRYRICCEDQRRWHEDPPPFAVRGARTAVDFDVATPRTFRV
jgi:hypothetical protein